MVMEFLTRIQVPLGTAAAVVVVAISGYAYLNEHYVQAEDFKQFQKTLEFRSLERDKNSLEREVLRLEVKQEAYPQKFDEVDKALLRRQKDDLTEVKKEIKTLKTYAVDPPKKAWYE